MPLSKEQKDKIQKGIATATALLKEGKADLQDAKRAGIDMTAQEEQVKDLEMKLRKMKAVYG